jgi:hypothetical protein
MKYWISVLRNTHFEGEEYNRTVALPHFVLEKFILMIGLDGIRILTCKIFEFRY